MGRIDEGIVTRRALLGGLGAGGAAVVVGAAAAESVGAAPATGAGGPARFASAGAAAALVPATSLASPELPGITYDYVSMVRFRPHIASTAWLYDQGMWAGNEDPANEDEPGGVLIASVPVPPGALLHDVEWYVLNEWDNDIVVTTQAWVPGQPIVGPDQATVETTVPPALGVRAVQSAVPADLADAWTGVASVELGITTPLGGQVQINGARVGFSSAPQSITMLDRPVRVYDSRNSGGALKPNTSRVIPLGAAVPVTAGGALVSLSITAARGTGTLRVGRAGVAPTATGLQWSRTGDKVTNLVVTGIDDAARMVVQSIAATGSTEVIAEVVGYLV